MTDRHLRDLLHDRVADLHTPDLSETAWTAAGRVRRRRQALGVLGVAGLVAATVLGSSLVTGPAHRGGAPATGGPTGPSPAVTGSVTGSPAPYDVRGRKADATYRGASVWWGPTVAQESSLGWLGSPLPRSIDLSGHLSGAADAPARTVDHALAAYAVMSGEGLERFLLLTPDGALVPVDISRVQEVSGPDGTPRLPVGDQQLSPTGDYLMFPQQHSLLVMDVSTGEWRTIDTGGRNPEFARWVNDVSIWLPPADDGGPGPTFDARTGLRDGGMSQRSPRGPLPAMAAPYGRWRDGIGGTAQSFDGVDGVPLPPGAPTPAQALVVEGFSGGPQVLTFGEEASDSSALRLKDCCGVQFWLDADRVVFDDRSGPGLIAWRVGTHEFGRVAEIAGLQPDQETYAASYARIWTDRRPLG